MFLLLFSAQRRVDGPCVRKFAFDNEHKYGLCEEEEEAYKLLYWRTMYLESWR